MTQQRIKRQAVGRHAVTLGSLAGFLGVFVLIGQVALAQDYAWQVPHARVLPHGDLEWAPEPFAFQAGSAVYCIDYENGDDANRGTRAQPWKHHPWDPNAGGQAAQASGPATYVFRRGVTYRGVLSPGEDRGTPEEPIRLTSDPSWGEGEARIYGSAIVTDWQLGGHDRMPQRDRVWSAEVDFLPRTLWMVGSDGEITRLTLARDPNWTEPDPNDPMADWPTWENPRWWTGEHVIKVGDQDRHLGIDTQRLTRPAADYVGATVWTEWGIVMGSPYPSRVEAFCEEERGVSIRGPWTWNMSERIITGNRYYLENMPWMLDEPGEYWVERLGDNRARIHVRLPDDSDPNDVTIEAGRHINILDADQLHHVHVSGLTFRFTNIHWDYDTPRWVHPEVQSAVIRLEGIGDDIRITHNLFEHVHTPVRMRPTTVTQQIGTIAINDNQMRYTDHGAVVIHAHFDGDNRHEYGRAEYVEMLRNNLYHIGWRIISGEHGHAVDIRFPHRSHIAGNFLYRIAGWGISVFGGKGGGRVGLDVPFSRYLIHHNRVHDVLLKSNDWGGIETWQGGPFYVFNNLVINPRGFKNWIYIRGQKDRVPAFGHAYYADGAFKNYLFNNIAWGLNNEPGGKDANSTALQNIISFENTFFHNTFFRFAAVTRQQAPSAGRFRYLGNVIDDASLMVFRSADPRDTPPDPNAEHYTQGGQFAYETIAYRGNVMHDIRGSIGTFEETGYVYDELGDFAGALERLNAQAAGVGVVSDNPPLRDPAGGDFRPAPDSAAIEHGQRVFVPWALYGVVGEWQFIRNNADPSEIVDTHWYMTPAHAGRGQYKDMPRYPLRAVSYSDASHVQGVLDDWSPASALRLDGQGQYLTVPHASLPPVPPPADRTVRNETVELEFATVELPETLSVGEPVTVTVHLKAPQPTQQVGVHLHWFKRDSWGGLSTMANPTPVAGEPNSFRFTFMAGRHGERYIGGDLHHYGVRVFLSPDGSAERLTQEGQVLRDLSPVLAPGPDEGPHRTVNVTTGNFLIEALLQTSDPRGTLVRKMDRAGYALDLVAGRPRLMLRDAEGVELTATANAAIADGQWVHLIVEVDRRGDVAFYANGRRMEVQVTGRMPTDTLANEGDFLVGGGPGAEPLAVTLDYLRVARGTLADARTTIGELYAWQFDGPHLRDFAGNDRRATNAAGALVAP